MGAHNINILMSVFRNKTSNKYFYFGVNKARGEIIIKESQKFKSMTMNAIKIIVCKYYYLLGDKLF